RIEPSARSISAIQGTATIHWQKVPLRDAVARLQQLFEEPVFVDRRVDPSQRISLDIEASRVEDVLTPIIASRGLGVSRLDRLVYLGPRNAAEQLGRLAALRTAEVGRLPASQRAALTGNRSLSWTRLAEPRELVTALVEQRGWRLEKAQRIPHDLWPAGELPELPLAEQLTVLLIGFDLTFEMRSREQTIAIVPIDLRQLQRWTAVAKPQAEVGSNTGAPAKGRTSREMKQVYTLRVAEQPVRAVLQELARRLNWQIEIDETAIRAAGRSVDARVSFAVENVGQDELLEALLRPAGLGFHREDEQITIVPWDDAAR
ncbi:MAG: hypothetical protein WD229_17950, partial [Pirellulales bacterium]